jgi:hypothetical protein
VNAKVVSQNKEIKEKQEAVEIHFLRKVGGCTELDDYRNGITNILRKEEHM